MQICHYADSSFSGVVVLQGTTVIVNGTAWAQKRETYIDSKYLFLVSLNTCIPSLSIIEQIASFWIGSYLLSEQEGHNERHVQ